MGLHTAAVFYFAGTHFGQAALALETVIETAHAAGRPVVVDAAAQLPPADNPWRFTRELGADLAIFSGGKGLRGPQSSGLVVGRADLIDLCRAQGAPNPRRGRAMKVGKEEMYGLLAAVERYLQGPEEFSLLLFDVVMPGKSGPEALTEIRHHNPNIPAILCSGYTETSDVWQGLPERVEFVPKPYEPDRLLTLMRRLLGTESARASSS